MSTVLSQHGVARATRRNWRPWAFVLAGLACLYVPTYLDLARTLWRDDAYAHGPIVLAVFAWLVWRARDFLLTAPLAPAPVAGSLLFAAGLLLYLLGRTQSLPVFEVASHLPVLMGALLLLVGPHAVRRLAFPLVFLAFLVPLPGFVMDAVTVPLKDLVSVSVEWLLNALGYPVVRSGVVLELGDHQMLVADACSGLNSIFSLFALALLYTHVTRPRRPARTALLLAGIVPIAIAANVIRVAALVLVNHYWGEDAAQGFMHGFAGMVVFVSALILLMAYDWALTSVVVRTGRPRRREVDFDRGGIPRLPGARAASYATAFVLGIAMAATAGAAPLLKPVPVPDNGLSLERMIPASFGDWRLDPEVDPIAPTPDVQANLDRLYRQILSRTYVNAAGERIMLMVAYGGDQSDALKAHRQESCYAAQGFAIQELRHGSLATAGRTIPVTRMFAVRGDRAEPVTYWFTMGDRVVLGRAERLQVQLENGLAGRIPDGMLVRVSNLSADPARAYALHESFVAALMAALRPADATRFVGLIRN
ncbi:MAG TPA: exosortase B [Usitatibacter sp.]|nr:exosortase B [Usitatibacter sp.]